jgi:hypothetical protein
LTGISLTAPVLFCCITAWILREDFSAFGFSTVFLLPGGNKPPLAIAGTVSRGCAGIALLERDARIAPDPAGCRRGQAR